MIRINRIAYAVFGTPDLSKQVEDYTRVLGLTVVETSAKAVYLSGGVAHVKDSCDLLALEGIPLVWVLCVTVSATISRSIIAIPTRRLGSCSASSTALTRRPGHSKPELFTRNFRKSRRVWSDLGLAANMWGTPPPDGFLD